MSGIKSEDGKKWINAFIALSSILVGFLVIKFFDQMGEWFDLEAKIGHFSLVSQGLGVLLGLGTFIFIVKSKPASAHLDEVFQELTKVIWPNKDDVLKAAFGIVIGLVIVSGIFVFFDFIFNKLLDLFY
jgi:preprotein translocase subunit SecE